MDCHYVLLNYGDDEHRKVGHAMIKVEAQFQYQFLDDYADDAKQKLAKQLGVSPLKIMILDYKIFNDSLMFIDC